MKGKLGLARAHARSQVGVFAKRLGNYLVMLGGQPEWHCRQIGHLAEALKPRVYVEIGVYEGETLRTVAPWTQSAIGVDINPACGNYVRGIPNATFVNGTSADLGADLSYHGAVDLLFIDADHSHEAVLEDFQNCLPLLSDNAMVAIHDTWPATEEFSAPRFCSDSYRVPELLRSQYPEWNFVTVSCHPGLTLGSRRAALPQWISQ